MLAPLWIVKAGKLADALFLRRQSAFNVVFALEDLEGRVAWYYKSGWREHQERLERYSQAYSLLEEWKDWLETFKAGQEYGASTWGVSKEERANLKLIAFWPLPSKMVRYALAKTDNFPETRAFLQFLNDWFYSALLFKIAFLISLASIPGSFGDVSRNVILYLKIVISG